MGPARVTRRHGRAPRRGGASSRVPAARRRLHATGWPGRRAGAGRAEILDHHAQVQRVADDAVAGRLDDADAAVGLLAGAGISTCSGARAVAGRSWIWPSVMATMPARRPRGMSASAWRWRRQSRVPSWPASGTLTRAQVHARQAGGLGGQRRGGAAGAGQRGRPPAWRRSCRSPAARCRTGSGGFPGPAWARRARRAGRRRRPRARRRRGRGATGRCRRPGAAGTASRASSQTGSTGCEAQGGDGLADHATGPAVRGWRARAPGRPCSSRSARTSPGSRRSGRPGCAGAGRRGRWRKRVAVLRSCAQAAAQSLRADDDRADAVVAAVLVLLHPDGVAVEAAGEILQQVEGAGQHVVGVSGARRRDVQPAADAAQRGGRSGRRRRRSPRRVRRRRACRSG